MTNNEELAKYLEIKINECRYDWNDVAAYVNLLIQKECIKARIYEPNLNNTAPFAMKSR